MKKRLLIISLASVAIVFAAEQTLQPPMPPSPVAEFRGWLNKSPQERSVALAKRSDKNRAVIEQKLREYSALTREERERRLAALELWSYLRPLMQLPADIRTEALARVPIFWQPIVMTRLEQWDRMPANLQKEVLDHEMMMRYLGTPALEREGFLRTLSPEDRQRLEARMGQWQVTSAVERRRLDDRLNEFFNLAPEQQRKTLNQLSSDERQKMQETLGAFRQLTPEQRQLCVNSFAKFTSMTRDEQIAFLKNAERWQAMSQEERETWRKVVQLVPPMPPLPIPQPPQPR